MLRDIKIFKKIFKNFVVNKKKLLNSNIINYYMKLIFFYNVSNQIK